MKIEISRQTRNELLKRDELAFIVDHQGNGTISRIRVREKLANMLNADIERVYVKTLVTKTGSTTTIGEANIYDSAEQAKYVEPEYIMLRNAPKSEEEKKE